MPKRGIRSLDATKLHQFLAEPRVQPRENRSSEWEELTTDAAQYWCTAQIGVSLCDLGESVI